MMSAGTPSNRATEKGQRDAALKLVAPQDYSLGEKYRSFNPTG
jgi:hypothetical protein